MMLEFLRQRTKSWLVYLMFGVIIAVFILTFNPVAGRGGQCGGGASPLLAQVGEKAIDLNTLYMGLALTADPAGQGQSSQALQQDYIYRNTRFYYGGVKEEFLNYNPEPKAVSPIKMQKVMNDLIETYLVSEMAARLGLAVSVEDVTNRVLNSQRFDNPDTGVFDADAYTRFVRYTLKTTKPRYEDFVRREILRERVIQTFEATTRIPSSEVSFYVDGISEEVNLEYVELSPKLMSKGIEISPEDIAAHAEKNGDAIQKFFDENQSRFAKPERVKVRGIFHKAPFRFFRDRLKEPEKLKEHDEQWSAARAKASETHKALLAALVPVEGAEAPDGAAVFSELAKENSEHPGSNSDGGVFDSEFSKDELGRWPFGKEVGEKAFGLENGAVSEPIEVDNGIWILRVDNRLAASERSLEDATSEISEELLRTERAKKGLEAAATALIKVASSDPAALLNDAVNKWNSSQGLDEESAPKVQETGTFSRIADGPIPPVTEQIGQIPRIGQSRELLEAAFKLTAEAPVPERTFSAEGQNDNIYVVRLKERVKAADVEKVRDRVTKELSLQHARLAFRSLVSDLRRAAEKAGNLQYSSQFNEMMAQELKNLETKIPGVIPSAK